jgi:hypothetical protein
MQRAGSPGLTSLGSKAGLTHRLFLVASPAMRLKWIFLLGLGLMSALLFSGCVETLDGRHRAGVPFGNDRIMSRYERSPAQCWAAAKDVLKFQGTLTSEDSLRSVLEAVVDERRVWVAINPYDGKTTQMIVQCRGKGGGTDMQLAAFIDKEIGIRIATGNLTPATPDKPKP